jgi:hypothetical protein
VLAVRPRGKVEAELFELWKELNPAGAYLDGIEECRGRVFEGESERIQALLHRIDGLRPRARGRLARKLLDSFEISLRYEEPFNAPNMLLNAIFGYLVKEGLREEAMAALLRSGLRALANSRARLSGQRWSLPLRLLTRLACKGLSEAVGTIKEMAQSSELRELCELVTTEAERYAQAFGAPELREGTYEEVMRYFEEDDADMGRAQIYEAWLRNALDYSEDAQRLIRKGEAWIDSELPKLTRIMARLSKLHGCEPTLAAVSEALSKADGLKGPVLIEKTHEIRKVLQPYIHRHVVRVPRTYSTEVMRTPPYLAGMLPTAAAMGLDSLTDRPRQLYLVTVEEKFAPMSSLADIINTYVHEEMGHDLHFARSCVGYMGRPRLLERLNTSFAGPVSEGIAFQRETEFLWALRRTLRKRRRSAEEAELLSYLERNGGLKRRLLEIEFVTRKWRLIRFLRVVGDASINSGRMTLPQFLAWAEQRTGIDRRTMYYQLFLHQLNGPGYATSYAVIGQEIAAVERPLLRNGKKLVRLATYACSLGYPPRSIFRRRLREFARMLRSADRSR